MKCDGTHAETRFRLSSKRTNPFKSAGASVQSTTGSQAVHISGSNAAYTMFRGSVKSTGYLLHLNRPVGASVQSTAGSRGVRISGNNAGYTMFRGSVKSTGYPTPFARFPFTSPYRASPCAITFQLQSTYSTHPFTCHRFCLHFASHCTGKYIYASLNDK